MKYIITLCCLLITSLAYGQAPVITDFNPKMAETGELLTLTGSGFNATSSNNVVYFGSIPATILNASTNSLEVEIPAGIKADKISVLNTVSNLNAQTPTNFYPTFDGGARIIPASFLSHQDLAIDSDASTVRMADIDGDGWLDIGAAMDQEISIFRNTAMGGKLTSSSFASKIDLPVGIPTFGGRTRDLGFSDLDNDGKPDLYFSLDINEQFAPYQGAICIYRNTSTPGSISFDPVTIIGVNENFLC